MVCLEHVQKSHVMMTALASKWVRVKSKSVRNSNIWGVVFTKSRSFYKARKHNYDHAKKAMHPLYKRIRNLNLPIDLQLQLFEHTLLPIALYGCEIWAFENTYIIEKLQTEFLRYITNSKKSTPAYMLHA